jgi:DNA-binding response OmpR family regulator
MKQTLLIIDDDQTLVDALAMVLHAEGFEVLSAHSGEAGLAVLSDTPVDLVVLDLRLPGMQGLEVLHKLREASPGLPVIIITAYCQEERRQEIEQLGVVAILCKPFASETILSLIAERLGPAPEG